MSIDWATPHNARRLDLFRTLLGVFPPGRLIDLGTGHGRFAQEAADAGWDVTAVDARSDRWPDDPRVTWLRADVRDIPLEGYDVVSCLGLLYHLTLEDQLSLFDRCAGTPLLLDTHLAVGRSRHPLSDPVTVDGYDGRWYEEPSTLLASWENQRSFWATPASFRAMLADHGYPVVLQADPPVDVDRNYYLALRGTAQT